jgi:MFS family permease
MDLKLNKVFYGWWIVGACFLLNLVLGGFVVLSFTAFFEPIANQFGWSYAQISLATSLRGVEAGLIAPILGVLVDRWGPKRLVIAGVAILGLGFMVLSRTTSLGIFYLASAVIALGSSGLSPTVIMTAVANWFKKKVGIATGILATGFAFGSLLILLVVRLIDAFGWQTAIFILGVSVWIIGIPLALLLRHRPEQYGYVVDGSQNENTIHSETESSMLTDEKDFKIREVLRGRVFWHISLAMTFQFLVISAISLHVMPYLTTVGFPRSTSSLVATAIPLTSIAGRLGSGWLIDRFNKVKVAAAFFAMSCTGVFLFNYISSESIWLLFPFILVYGIGWGGNATIRTALVREYFGRRKFGTIFGLTMGLVTLGGIIGPFFAGWIYDSLSSYHVAWLLFACFIFVAMIIIATTPQVVFYTRSTGKDK